MTPLEAVEARRPYRFSVEEVLAMVEAGILPSARGLELIEGELIEMAPIGPGHASCTTDIADQLRPQIAPDEQLRIGQPIVLANHSMPEPDLSIVRRSPDHYRTAHPTAEDTLLVIEVSDSSLKRDRQIKLGLYARAGIPEVWILDLTAQALEAYREPAGDHYAQLTTLRPPAVVTASQLAEARLDLGALFA